LSLNLGKLFTGVGVKRVAQTEENWIAQFTQAASGTVAIGTRVFSDKFTRFSGGVTQVNTSSIPYSMPNNESASIVDIYTPSGTIVAGTDFVFDINVNDIPQKISFSAIAGNVANGAGRAKILKPVNIPASFPFQPVVYTALSTFTGASQVQTFVLRALLTPTK